MPTILTTYPIAKGMVITTDTILPFKTKFISDNTGMKAEVINILNNYTTILLPKNYKQGVNFKEGMEVK